MPADISMNASDKTISHAYTLASDQAKVRVRQQHEKLLKQRKYNEGNFCELFVRISQTGSLYISAVALQMDYAVCSRQHEDLPSESLFLQVCENMCKIDYFSWDFAI